MAVGAAPLILLIPSERLRALRGLLVAAGAPTGSLYVLDEAADLLGVHVTGPAARIVLDVDAFPTEDTGLLRRFCQAHHGIELVWVGADARRHAKLERGGLGGSLRSWPLTVDDLTDIAAPGEADLETTGGANPTGGAELHRIAAILGRSDSGGRGGAEDPAGEDPARDRLAALDRVPPIAPHRRSARLDRGDLAAQTGLAFGRGPRQAQVWQRRAAEQRTTHQESRPSSGTDPLAPEGRREGMAGPRTAFLPSPAAPSPVSPSPVSPSPGADRRGSLPARTSGAARPPLGNDLQHAESGTPPAAEGGSLDEPLLSEEEIEAFFAPTIDLPDGWEPSFRADSDLASTEPAVPAAEESTAEESTAEESTAGEPLTAARPRWMKDQIADLADIVQGLDLAARRAHAHVGIEHELARLRQFTRTLGLVASPPPRGDQHLDVATLVEEMLGSLAGTSPDAPRLLFRKRGGSTRVKADKALLACSLDAVLQTAIACSGSGDVVRVSVEAPEKAPEGTRRDDSDGRPRELVCGVEFRPGPLEGRSPAEVMQPYALKAALPVIGANALAAAGAIAVGQGGDLTLVQRPRGEWTFQLSLPVD